MDQERFDVMKVARSYFDAFLLVRPELITASFCEDARKVGFMYDYDNRCWEGLTSADRDEAVAWASTYNAKGMMPAREPTLELLDLQSKIATVKLVAEWAPERWGIDHLVLIKTDSNWKIALVLWQSAVPN